MWGSRVIPTRLRSEVLQVLHESHVGVVRMKALARSYVWWPGIDLEIEGLAKRCSGCQRVQHAPNCSPLHPREWPSTPWRRIHVDFAGPFLGMMFLVIVDAHSKWPEVIIMHSKTTTSKIKLSKPCEQCLLEMGYQNNWLAIMAPNSLQKNSSYF